MLVPMATLWLSKNSFANEKRLLRSRRKSENVHTTHCSVRWNGDGSKRISGMSCAVQRRAQEHGSASLRLPRTSIKNCANKPELSDTGSTEWNGDVG